jgi:hypothetical protein
MMMMVIKRVLVEKCLCQDPMIQSLMFENLPARGAWVCGCASLRLALDNTTPQKPDGCSTYRAPKGTRVAGCGQMEESYLFYVQVKARYDSSLVLLF